MPISVGGRIGPYEILEPLGAGGMGEVYRARDAKLNRDVAIKVLPELFSTDPERLARFRREAQVLASLNHPNIGHIHGFEDSSNVHALVLELVEGPTLADRIAQGPIPLDDTIAIARQIADALECAHEQGIIHRDLKPANIKLRPDGTVKVLDFGLAKALDPLTTSGSDAMNSPTLTARGTQLGVIVGTAAYMAPEQARGRAVDRRADIWAFGVVLYEMLAGKRAFEGDDISITLAAVLKNDVDWKALPANLPTPLIRVLRRCLDKDPRHRLSAVADARLELEAALQPETPAASGALPRSRAGYAAMAAVALVGAVLGGLAVWLRAPSKSTPSARMEFAIDPPFQTNPLWLALSPDGSQLAYLARETPTGPSKVCLRALDSQSVRVVEGTENAVAAVWAGDNRRLLFVSGNRLYVVDLTGGAPTPLATLALFAGATWHDDVILYSDSRAIWRVAATGGTPTEVLAANPAAGEERVMHPSFLPDGQRFLYLSWSGGEDGRAVYVATIDGKERRRLVASDAESVYASGHLLFFVRRTLMAQPFDSRSATLSGKAVQVTTDVLNNVTAARAAFDASQSGLLVYRGSADFRQMNTVKTFDRSGTLLRTIGERGGIRQLRLSPDSRRLAIERRDRDDFSDIHTVDVATGIATRLTFNEQGALDPVWSSNSREVAYSMRQSGQLDVMRSVVGDAKGTPVLVGGESVKFVDDWSPDGNILFRDAQMRAAFSVHATGRGQATKLVDGIALLDSVRLSSDGRRVAYQAMEASSLEVHVADFPSFARRTRISSTGGAMPRWRGDGKELYYLSMKRELMAVPVGDFAGNTFGVPVALFTAPVPATVLQAGIDLFDVSADGKTFYVIAEDPDTQARVPSITVVANWVSGLHKR